MPPQDPTQTPAEPQPINPLSVMQSGEQTLFELKRHPIGIIINYTMTAVMLAVLAVIGLVVAPTLVSNGASQVRSFVAAGLIVFAMLSIIFNLIATIVYWGNRWILTSDSITELIQTSLFHKTTSQLEIESLEDVSADKNGILQHIFNYGTLKAETAGEASNFIFPFAPNPTYYAKQILEACEKARIEDRERNRYAPAPVPAPAPQNPTQSSSPTPPPSSPIY